MNKGSTVALLTFGTVVIAGLGVLIHKVFGSLISSNDPTVLIAKLVLIVAIAAGLTVIGVFLGYLYGRPHGRQLMSAEFGERLRGALEFERKERVRLERDLYEAKQAVVGLEDRLRGYDTELRGREAEARERAAGSGVSDADKRTLEKQAADAAEQAARLEADLAQLTNKHDRLRTDLTRRKERIADLMAELSIAQADADEARDEAHRIRTSMVPESPASPASELLTDASSVKEILGGLTNLEGVQLALIADDYGLVVESAGTGMPPDTLAAISSLMAHIGPRVKDILPIGEVTTVVLGDDQGLVIENLYFDLAGTRCSLTIAREKGHAYPRLAETAAASIREHLG